MAVVEPGRLYQQPPHIFRSNFMAYESKRQNRNEPALHIQPKPVEDDGERRAAERRAQEAKAREQEANAKVEQQIAEAKAAEAKAQEAATAKTSIVDLVAEARERLAGGRKRIEERKEQLRVATEAVGNLEGAVITANDVARRDPQRALEALTRAVKAFDLSVVTKGT